ncbi:alpha/beta fold hydrolase [Oceanobacter mangrovi]|uniref:alpha/beta fold hydrolase n=1 Tax=Oceanobacter mangrovi TaxID=2862510 RepID=UPI001C8DB4ED|nr:alpha/beta hydrolase [Oceanobacter mangrovi]
MKFYGLTDWRLVSDGTICGYRRDGENGAPGVHLLHGNGFCGMSLLALAECLPASWTILISDAPGHGRSRAAAQAFPVWSDMADTLARFVAHELVNDGSSSSQSIVAIGHSMGGVLTTMMAARHPGLFGKLILLDPVLMPVSIIRLQQALRLTRLWHINPLVRQARQRRSRWTDRDAARRYFLTKKLYQNWHPRSLDGFTAFGLVDDAAGVKLACEPEWEGRLFGSAPDRLWHSIRGVQVPTRVYTAGPEFGFIEPAVERALRMNPAFSKEAFGGSHCFPMEQPQHLAEKMCCWLDN